METYYLIDFENIGSDGLAGCDKLGENDRILIFFTQNAKKIEMSAIADHGQARLSMMEIPSGKQSADIHIASYAGYLGGKTDELSVFIISKDTDFDHVLAFLSEHTNASFARAPKIADALRRTRLTDAGKPEKETVSGSAPQKTRQKAAPKDRKEQNAAKEPKEEKQSAVFSPELLGSLTKAGFGQDIISFTAAKAQKLIGQKNGKAELYRALISEYGQAEGLGIYTQIKKYI